MSYIRLNKHYVHLPYLFLGIAEAILLVLAAWFALSFIESMADPEKVFALTEFDWPPFAIFSFVLSCCTLSMGVYLAMVREGFRSMVLRTIVSFFFLGSLSLYLLALLLPHNFIHQGFIFWSVITGSMFVIIARVFFMMVVDTAKLKRRVVIYGAGNRAKKLLEDLAPEIDVVGVQVVGCIPNANEHVQVSEATTLPYPSDWLSFVRNSQISEIVVSPDERRRVQGDSAFPLNDFLDCKLAGVPSCDALSFCERELGKIDITLLQPSWMLYSDGFKYSKRRLMAKRLFDLILASAFFAVLWPFMLLTAIAVKLESPGPVLYHQVRVGLNGRHFRIYKFRSMRQDAEKHGAMWAQKNDSRVTKVGAFIRNTRLDELPQLYNVLAGSMSFVGPRPERPEFVTDLAQQIPFYDTRHKVKPGLMGWAQLKYPYGASVEDAKNKLQYDLYYTKNHSFLMDMLIMIQTVEIILLGKGVH
ncbi:TIGR03013 family XrtA/PEP-CTERM system glycosyltransferase [Cellvibrio zantedeschiae]|uniref:TIGR03013 family XrtA/PEP-CTERM system glycosyltransferase n=1 Tax=Cellvibrio zantedeschiae TaxID=1237077 RepID=UPI001678C9BE|nr:TIGR03013 family XrtA/PEP-CTERM system glycosyltransferase [Cellvibrio zantedeschiae]